MATDPDTILNDPLANDPPAADPPVVANDQPAGDPPASDWRADLAGEDKELLGFLGRYHSREAGLKAWKKQHDEIRSGKYIKPLGEDATDEDKAAWNKFLGVPEKPEGYLEAVQKSGLVIGDDDKPALEKVLAKAHAVGAPPAAVNALVEGYYELVDEQEAALAEANDSFKQAGEEALLEEWGPDRRRNLNVVRGYIETLPEGVTEALLGGRDSAGMALANNPEVIKWLASLAMDANPLATVVPGAGTNAASAMADEIAALEQRMATDRVAWFKDERAQARHLELITARDRMK